MQILLLCSCIRLLLFPFVCLLVNICISLTFSSCFCIFLFIAYLLESYQYTLQLVSIGLKFISKCVSGYFLCTVICTLFVIIKFCPCWCHLRPNGVVVGISWWLSITL